MRAFFDRLTANAGSALTVGGTVLAIGLGLGAVGLAEVPSGASPWRNPFVVGGLAMALLGLAWVLATFIAAMIVTAKSERFRYWLGVALLKGLGMFDNPPLDNSQVKAWAEEVYELIKAALGEYEADLFQSDYDLPPLIRGYGDSDHSMWLRERLQRVSRLLDRAHAMSASLAFNGKRQWFTQSSKAAISESDQT